MIYVFKKLLIYQKLCSYLIKHRFSFLVSIQIKRFVYRLSSFGFVSSVSLQVEKFYFRSLKSGFLTLVLVRFGKVFTPTKYLYKSNKYFVYLLTFLIKFQRFFYKLINTNFSSISLKFRMFFPNIYFFKYLNAYQSSCSREMVIVVMS